MKNKTYQEAKADEFNKFLKSIGGLENGFTAYPNPHTGLFKYNMFMLFKFFRFPDRRNPFRLKITDRHFFSIYSGWLDLVTELIKELISIGWNKELSQCKEKFGGLRFYTNGLPNTGHDIIRKYEDLSFETCELCGKPGTLRQEHWMKTQCNECYKQK